MLSVTKYYTILLPWLQKKLSSRSDTEASLQRDVDDLKNRLAMSAEAYTQVVVKSKMVQKELKRVRQLSELCVLSVYYATNITWKCLTVFNWCTVLCV